MLCVRHLLGLRAADRWAGQVTARGAVERADILIGELTEAFRKSTWAHRDEARGPEMNAWRRAAAFLDGGAFCGCPPRET
jgi:transcriptional regulator of nitric oxide reductase